LSCSFLKIAYSKKIYNDALNFYPVTLLAEKGIVPQSITVTKAANLPIFFQNEAANVALPYDPFAMIFYLVSRYEEYLPSEKDEHDRFPAAQSLAFRANFLHLPLVDFLVKKIKKLILEKNNRFFFNEKKYTFLPTYDVDYAWAYLHRDVKRTAGGYAKALIQRDFEQIKRRIEVSKTPQKDPFFTFPYLHSLHKKLDLKPIFFFLIGDYGTFDKNISHKNTAFQQLIQNLALHYPIGVHPSYQSNQNIQQLQIEKQRLENITKKTITFSRQHFLKLNLPKTYQNLLNIGITNDFTMGYAEKIGFRASTATPYFWYDLQNEKETNLRLTPFQVMDVTLKSYLKLSQHEALDAVQKLVETTKSVEGTFSTLWHNSSLSEVDGWGGWEAVYETICAFASE
jgi:hypothetical protein